MHSKLDGKVLEGQDDGTVKMKTYDPKNPRQLWIQTNVGQQWLNFETSLPMMASNGRNWIWKERCTENCMILDARNQNQALDRGWETVEGTNVITFEAHGADNQRWNYVQVNNNAFEPDFV